MRDSIEILRHIFKDYGWLKSKRIGRSVNAQGDPLPWFTYPAIDFITQLDLSNLRVFEFGAGYSTLFWARRAKAIVSTEDNEAWHEEIRSKAPPNAKLILSSNCVESYVGKIKEHGSFDVIVIDGIGESRLPCAQTAPMYLNVGGFIILDNSDLWPAAAAELRNAGLIQVDFSGLAALSPHWHTTSIFFSRDYSIQPIEGRQPHRSVAQPAKPWIG